MAGTLRDYKRYPRNILYAAAACLICAELAARLFAPVPDLSAVRSGRFRFSNNSNIGYELVPDFDAGAAGPMLDFTGKGNSLGFRDREHPVKKPDGIFRVLVIGDSIVQGLGVASDDEIFTAVLERALNERGRRVEVINFGVSGYNTLQEVETLKEKGLPFAPDLVVLLFCIDDLSPGSPGLRKYLDQAAMAAGVVPGLPGMLQKSALVNFFSYQFLKWRGSPPPLWQHLDTFNLADQFKQLGALSRQARFTTLVAWLPRLAGSSEAADDALRRIVAELAKAKGMEFHDLSQPLNSCAAGRSVGLDHLHPNTLGHSCIGRELAGHVALYIHQ